MDAAILNELKQIKNLMVKQMAETDLEFTSKHSEIDIRLVDPIDINNENGAYICFKSLFMYYSIPNISSKNNNFKYSFINNLDSGQNWRDIFLEPGSYEIENIETNLQHQIKSYLFYDSNDLDADFLIPKITIKADHATGRSVIEVPANCQIDFTTNNSIGKLLGFNKKILKQGIHVSDNLIDIMSINSLNVTCDIAQGSIVNGNLSNRLHTFFPNESPGEKINEKARNLIWYPVNCKKIDRIVVRLVDQNGDLIDNRGDEITIILSLRY